MFKYKNITQECECPACNLFFGTCRNVKKIYNSINSKLNPKSKYIKN